MKAGDQLHTFTIQEVLGHGGMGGVFVGQNSENGELVAIKTLFEEFSKDEAYVRRFQREASVYRKLNHPNIVRCIASGFDRGVYFIAMEHIKGKSLDVIIKDNGALGVEHTLKIVDALAGAVYHAHSRGVVHRDIKPQNIMINEQGVVKLLDFGVAQADDDLVKTASGSIVGTFFYSSPEQNQGQKIDERSDLYSLGLVFYELLVGQRALNGATLLEVSSLQMQGRIRPPSTLDSTIPTAVEKVVMKLLERDPNQRHQSARDLQVEVRALLDGQQRGAAGAGQAAGAMERELAAKWSQAKEAFARRDLDRALELAIEVSRGKTANAEIHCLLGKIYAAKEYTYNAIEEFKKTMALDPGNCQYKVDFAVALYSMKMVDRSKEEFQKVLEIDPNNPFAKQYIQLIDETDVDAVPVAPAAKPSLEPPVHVETVPPPPRPEPGRDEGLFVPPPPRQVAVAAPPRPVVAGSIIPPPAHSPGFIPPPVHAAAVPPPPAPVARQTPFIPPPGALGAQATVPPPGFAAPPAVGQFIPPPGAIAAPPEPMATIPPPQAAFSPPVIGPPEGGSSRVAAYVPPPRRPVFAAENEQPPPAAESARDEVLGRTTQPPSFNLDASEASSDDDSTVARRFKSKVRDKKEEEEDLKPPLDPGRARIIALFWWGGGYLYIGQGFWAIVSTVIQAVVVLGLVVTVSAWVLPDNGYLGNKAIDFGVLANLVAGSGNPQLHAWLLRPLQEIAGSDFNLFLKTNSKEILFGMCAAGYLWGILTIPSEIHRYTVLSNLTGKIVEVRRDLSVKINLGEERGVQVGQIFAIQKRKHVDEVHALNFKTMMMAPKLFTIGEAKVVSTTLHFAICKFRRLPGETSNPSVGDRIVLRKSPK